MSLRRYLCVESHDAAAFPAQGAAPSLPSSLSTPSRTLPQVFSVKQESESKVSPIQSLGPSQEF